MLCLEKKYLAPFCGMVFVLWRLCQNNLPAVISCLTLKQADIINSV